MTNNGVDDSEISSPAPEIFKFCSKIDDVTNRLTMKIYHKTRISLQI